MQKSKMSLAASIALSLASFTAEASLTPGTAGGQSVVYSSISNVTWTGDANLLGTMGFELGYGNLIPAIIAASPIIYDTANTYDTPGNSAYHTVTGRDFGDSEICCGLANWYGAVAFTHYLNSINYAGSNQWTLPSPGPNPQEGFGSDLINSQFNELYYDELGGLWQDDIPDTSNFTHETAGQYWQGTEYADDPIYAWVFDTSWGVQTYDDKLRLGFVWAVSPGNIAAVPVPGAVWLFSSGLIGVFGFRRHRIN